MKVRFDSPKSRAPEMERGMKVPYPPERRKPPVWRWYLLLLLFLSPVFYFAWIVTQPFLIVSAPGFLRLDLHGIQAPVEGRVMEVKGQAGERVERNDPLLVLANLRLEGELEQTRSELEALQKGKREEIARKIETLARRRATLAAAVKKEWSLCRELEGLVHQGAATVSEVQACEKSGLATRLSLQEAEAALQALRQEQKRFQRDDARIALLRSRLKTLEKERRNLVVRAPVGGVVASLSPKSGEYVRRGERLGDIVAGRDVFVEAFFEPKHFDRLRAGTPVTVRFPDGFKMVGRIVMPPHLSARLPSDFTLLKEQKRAVLVRVETEKEIPPAYRVAQMPVEVRLKSGPLSELARRLFR